MDEAAMGKVIDGHTLRFVRIVPHSCERVWRAISDEKELRVWMRYPVSFERRVGGRVQFFGEGGIVGVVFTFDPPRVLAFSFWDAKAPDHAEKIEVEWEVRWELEPTAAGCRITFTHRNLGGAHLWGLGEGWHGFLDQLTAYLSGTLDELVAAADKHIGDTTLLTEYRARASQQLLEWTHQLAADAKAARGSGRSAAALNAIERMDFATAQLYEIARQNGPRPDYAPEPPPPRDV